MNIHKIIQFVYFQPIPFNHLFPRICKHCLLFRVYIQKAAAYTFDTFEFMDFWDTHGKECNATNIKYCNFFPAAGTIKWQLKVKKDQLRPPIMPHSMSWREGDIDILYMQRLIYIHSVECTKRMLDVVSMFLFHWLQCFTIVLRFTNEMRAILISSQSIG